MLNLLLPIIISLNVFADGFTDLAAKEEIWSAAELYSDGNVVEPVAKGYVTHDNKFRVELLTPSITYETALISSWMSRRGVSETNEYCNSGGFALGHEIKTERPYKLVLKIPAFSRQSTVDQIAVSKRGTGVIGVDQIVGIENATLVMSFKPDAKTLRYAQTSPDIIQSTLRTYMQSKISDLRANSEIELDISGYGYLACDFIQSNMDIGLKVNWVYENAKLTRTPKISDNEVAKIHNLAAVDLSALRNDNSKLIAASGLIALSLYEQTRQSVEKFGVEDFTKIVRSLYDVDSMKWFNLKYSDYSLIAKSLDKLSKERTRATTVVKTKFNGEIK